MSLINQGPFENPTIFIERLQDAFMKTKSRNTRRATGPKGLLANASSLRYSEEIPKSITGPNIFMLDILKIASSVFYIWGWKEEGRAQEKKKEAKRKVAALTIGFLTSSLAPLGCPQNTLPGNCHWCGKPDHWKANCPNGVNGNKPCMVCPLCHKLDHWRRDCPEG